MHLPVQSHKRQRLGCRRQKGGSCQSTPTAKAAGWFKQEKARICLNSRRAAQSPSARLCSLASGPC
eukprot:365855-Chlamydomonas_euryale.AAC.13